MLRHWPGFTLNELTRDGSFLHKIFLKIQRKIQYIKKKKKSTSFRTEQIIRTQGEHFSTENFLSFASDLPVIKFYHFGVLVPPFVIYLWYRYKGADSWKCSLLPRLIPHVLGGASPVKTSKKPSSRYRPKKML